MELSTLQALLQSVVTRHKKGIGFFTGLAKDFDPASNVNYPAVFVAPITNTVTLEPGVFINNYLVDMTYMETLPQDRTPAEVNATLDSTHRILREIILEFSVNFGFKETTFTSNNLTETINFTFDGPVNFLPNIDDGTNNTIGWQSIFTIQEQIKPDVCCLVDVFEPAP